MPSTFPIVQNRIRSALGVDSPCTIGWFPEAATQSFKVGDPVILSSGKVTIAAAAGAAIANVSGLKILGIAQTPATGVTDSKIGVAIADDNLEWLLPVGDDDGTSEVTAVTDVGVNYELWNNTTGWLVDKTETTDVHVVVTEIPPEYPVGEAWGLVWVRFMHASREFI